MFSAFYSRLFWTDHVDWTMTGDLIAKLKPTALGNAAKTFLESDFFDNHIVGPAGGAGPLNGTAQNDLIEVLGNQSTVRDGAGSDLIVKHGDYVTIIADTTDSISLDIFVNTPGSQYGLYVDYSNDSAGITLDFLRGRATGSAISYDRILGGYAGIGGAGNDIFIGSDMPEEGFTGGDGNDRMFGYGGFDSLTGGNGDDRLNGGDGDDWLDGQAGRDVIYGGGGNDSINVYLLPDFTSGPGDWIDGGEGNDSIRGNQGNDRIHGGTGDDAISTYFNYGTDNGGRDILSGGEGADAFLVLDGRLNYQGSVVILDFENGIDKLVSGKITSGGITTTIIGYDEFLADARDTAAGLVYNNGDGLYVRLQGFTLAMLDPTDFI
ncbi:MAG: calcium-binding protein [Aestuariivirga sp.]